MQTRLAHPLVSYTLVVSQFSTLIALVASTTVWYETFIALFLQSTGAAIGIWAAFTMRLTQIAILPDPSDDILLIQSGPYRFIRHPMYLSVLLIMIPMVSVEPTLQRLILLALLFVTLLTKLHYEEYLLKKRFSNYAAYQKRTKKLLPWVF
ncbi:MAG TPA: isoprenylcysteine carboxylmethyltransferase family protein [Sulfuricurvum sp.]|nr:isoprenylcysteine carboxylmethyltransferase family protein [Sulfuricurvum sp.]